MTQCPTCQSPDTKLLPRLRDGRPIAQTWVLKRPHPLPGYIAFERRLCNACRACWASNLRRIG